MIVSKPDSQLIQEKWSKKWEDDAVYSFDHKSSKPTYVIDSPPPFTSGALHMGHVLSYAFFDFAARFKRMQGYNVFYPQGWDCQGFPTEVKVEKKLGRGVSRQEFKKKCVEFTIENIAKMKSQMVRLGFSPDWKHEYKTIDPSYHKKVQLSILKMYEKELVYRKKHPVLFCTACHSAIAKAETDDAERETLLNYVNFSIDGDPVSIATTRPELLHACVALMVNPSDKRFSKYIGKKAVTPLFNAGVPVIGDKDVDQDFGSGIVMVCTFGDKTDVTWMYRHSLPLIEAVDAGGKLINAGDLSGLSVQKAREAVLEKLKQAKLLTKQDKLMQVVKLHDRCGKPAEFLSSVQWFMKITGWQERIKEEAKQMAWFPPFSLQYLIDWADFVEYDWVISRNRVYGTPLPFWYCEKCSEVYTPKEEDLPVDPALHKWPKACKCGGEVIGETAVCDCWVDSSITPLIIAGWPGKNWEKLYPSTLRPQGLEIIRTWAFYTIYRCLALTGKPPFKHVLINGNVLGTDGKKMSKSVGNFEDPEVLLTRFPADALRQWAALSGAFARDRPFSYKDMEYASSFLTKLWNAAKFVEKSLEGYNPKEAAKNLHVADKWILHELNQTVEKTTKAMDNYDYYAAITGIHSFFWHSFCDYYIEDVKYRIYDDVDKQAAQYCLSKVLETTLKLLAPFAPFTTEEINHALFSKTSVHSSTWPQAEKHEIDETTAELARALHFVVSSSRKYRSSKRLSLGQELQSADIGLPEQLLSSFGDIERDICSIARIKTLNVSTKNELFVQFGD